jgi:hypothetical protein
MESVKKKEGQKDETKDCFSTPKLDNKYVPKIGQQSFVRVQTVHANKQGAVWAT